MVALQLGGEASRGVEALVGIGLGEDDREALVDRLAQLLWQVVLQVSPFMKSATLTLDFSPKTLWTPAASALAPSITHKMP